MFPAVFLGSPRRLHCTMFAAILFALALSQPAQAQSLDRQLLKHAPDVIAFCHDSGYKNVGVLKFRVLKGQSSLTDNVGPLNLSMARKLELALVLANRVQRPLGIVHDASAVAATIPGANHTVAEGRPPLFTRHYPLAWGEQQVVPDAFLTGVIRIHDDLKRLAVGIVVVDRQNRIRPVVEFDADVDPFDLINAGESYLLRGPLEHDEQQLAQVVMSANRIRNREQTHPLNDPAAPVELEIRYDRTRMPIELSNGEALVREPREGQRVSLVLKRRPTDRTRYAIVLKVNGENTLYKQRLPELECSKWVLEPNLAEISVLGFQLTDKKVNAFKVLSRAESKEREMDYGADVGTISLVVFREGQLPARDPKDLVNDLDEDLAVLSRERFSVETPRNLSALQHQLRNDAPRGLMTEGEVIDGGIRKVEFTPNPVPVMSATITYYRP